MTPDEDDSPVIRAGTRSGHAVAMLIRHPSCAPDAIVQCRVEVAWESDGLLQLRYVLDGDIDRVRIPAGGPLRRADRLWQHTCFEMFVRTPGAAAYAECNFSASREWASYAFAGYREPASDPAPVGPLDIRTRRTARTLELEADVDVTSLTARDSRHGIELALSTVVESPDGTLSYWALRHPAGRPDFHDPGSFVLALPT
ncbi:MAG: hypothetical protein GC151_15475 [Betaproteobacteria bacterium]|nr:hypothetical protein [Betaproteobacteria bacterium]